jgi:hypothetical protein
MNPQVLSRRATFSKYPFQDLECSFKYGILFHFSSDSLPIPEGIVSAWVYAIQAMYFYGFQRFDPIFLNRSLLARKVGTPRTAPDLVYLPRNLHKFTRKAKVSSGDSKAFTRSKDLTCAIRKSLSRYEPPSKAVTGTSPPDRKIRFVMRALIAVIHGTTRPARFRSLNRHC